LEFPPHTLALGGLFVASLLTWFEQAPSDKPEWAAAQDISQKLRKKGDWERKFQSQVADMQGEHPSDFVLCSD
jgi:CTD kinase subunit beta